MVVFCSVGWKLVWDSPTPLGHTDSVSEEHDKAKYNSTSNVYLDWLCTCAERDANFQENGVQETYKSGISHTQAGLFLNWQEPLQKRMALLTYFRANGAVSLRDSRLKPAVKTLLWLALAVNNAVQMCVFTVSPCSLKSVVDFSLAPRSTPVPIP
ncbi:hypothetical protein RRG08_021441 [Elysia crispata]|uniref:Uncharacterized protein n=1 Tax=Elysia crispata TaxID=231223 RepID=A0AAE1A672_9GAST|nr:hypothetical protein RRG08_021441 [Elysia crispata]